MPVSPDAANDRHAEPAKLDLSLLGVLSVMALAVIAEASVYAMPLLVGEVIAIYRLQEGTVGLLISLQIALVSITAIAVSARIHRLNVRTVALAAIVMLAASHVLAASGFGVAVFAASRVLCGIAEGVCMAVAAAVAGQSRNPDRIFANIWIALGLMAAVLYLAIPRLSEIYGPQSAFLLLAALTLLSLAAVIRLPSRRAPPSDAAAPMLQDVKFLLARRSLYLMIAVALIAICNNGFFFFSVSIAADHGISVVRMGEIMVVMAFAAALGPALARFAATRTRRRVPVIVTGTMVSGVSAYLVTNSDGEIVFLIAMALAVISYGFVLPFVMGLASALVSGGRLASAGRGAQNLGSAITPGISGVILLSGLGYSAIGFVAIACALVASLLIFLIRDNGPDLPAP